MVGFNLKRFLVEYCFDEYTNIDDLIDDINDDIDNDHEEIRGQAIKFIRQFNSQGYDIDASTLEFHGIGNLDLSDGSFTYELIGTVKLQNAFMSDFTYDEETEEEDYSYEDAEVIGLFNFTFEDFQLHTIHVFIIPKEQDQYNTIGEREYKLWPRNEMPIDFEGRFGVIE